MAVTEVPVRETELLRTEQESDRTLEKLALVVETLRDRQIPIAP